MADVVLAGVQVGVDTGFSIGKVFAWGASAAAAAGAAAVVAMGATGEVSQTTAVAAVCAAAAFKVSGKCVRAVRDTPFRTRRRQCCTTAQLGCPSENYNLVLGKVEVVSSPNHGDR